MNTSIRFHFLSPATLDNRGSLKTFVQSIFKRHRIRLESLQIIFCDDAYLLNLNQQFLRHDYYTDIISFPLSKKGEPLIGELYISVDRVRDNAKNLEISFKEEIHRVIFHGILHFCGFKDKTPKDILKMRAEESNQLKRYEHRKHRL